MRPPAWPWPASSAGTRSAPLLPGSSSRHPHQPFSCSLFSPYPLDPGVFALGLPTRESKESHTHKKEAMIQCQNSVNPVHRRRAHNTRRTLAKPGKGIKDILVCTITCWRNSTPFHQHTLVQCWWGVHVYLPSGWWLSLRFIFRPPNFKRIRHSSPRKTGKRLTITMIYIGNRD